jgi:hypothetical protein
VAATQGNLLTCRMTCWDSPAGWAFTSSDVHDSSGTPKNFNIDVSVKDGVSFSGCVISSLIVPSGLTSPLLSVNTQASKVATFDEWTGTVASSVLDTTGSNHDSGSNVTTGTSGSINTAATVGIVFAVVSVNAASSAVGIVTTGTSFAVDTVEQDPNTYIGASHDSRTATVTSQTGLQDSWTWNTASVWCGCIASYLAAAGGNPPGLGPTVGMTEPLMLAAQSAMMR